MNFMELVEDLEFDYDVDPESKKIPEDAITCIECGCECFWPEEAGAYWICTPCIRSW